MQNGKFFESNLRAVSKADSSISIAIVDPDKAFNGLYYESVGGASDVAWYAARTTVAYYQSRLFLDLTAISGLSGEVEILSYPVNNGYSFIFSLGVDDVTIASVNTGTNIVSFTDGRANETFTGWVKVADDINSISTIDITDITSDAYPTVQAIRVGGVILEDSGYSAHVVSTDLDNNKMVVDGGEWHVPTGIVGQEYNWSDYVTSSIGTWYPGGANPSDTPDNAFDGNIATVCNPTDLSSIITFTPPVGIEYTSKVEVYFSGTAAARIYKVNDGPEVLAYGGWMEVANGSGTFEKLTLDGKGVEYVGFCAIKVDGIYLIDGGKGESFVEYQTKGGQGNIISINTGDNTLLVADTGNRDNRWIAENYGEGSATSTDFYIAPKNAVPIEQDYAWTKLQIVNNKAQVTGIQKTDPGFLPVPSKDYSIQFPSTFATGNPPDVDIPRGACIAAIVAAENSEGRSVKESNCYMPVDVNPEGAAGPITDSTPTQLTLASNANLGEFSPGDNLVMVDQDNNVSDYTMQTSEIENVEAALIEGIAQDNMVAQIGIAVTIDSQGEIMGYINNDQKLEAAGVTGITGFWVGYPGSNSSRFGSANTAGTQTFSLKGNWSGVGAGDIRDKVGISRTVGERYYSDNYSFETWWAGGSYPATGQPQGGVASTGMVEDDEIYGVIFDTPLTRSDATDDIDFRVLTYLDSNLATNEEIANSVSAIGIYDQNGDKVILYGRDDSKTELTFADPNPDLRYFRPGDIVQADAFVQDFTSAITGPIDPAYPGSKAFDGIVGGTYTNGCKPSTGNTLVWDTSLLDSVPYGKEVLLHVYCGRYDAGKDNLLRVNDTFSFRETNDTTLDRVVPVDISVNGQPGPLNTVSWTYTGSGSNYCYLKGIEVDGQLLLDGTTSGAFVVSTDFDNNKMIVDGGDWYVTGSTKWSDYLECAGGFYDGAPLFRPKTNAFDGDITTLASSQTQGDEFVFTPPTPINYTTSVRVHTQYVGEFTLNRGTPSEVSGIGHNGTVEWKTVATGSGTLISLTGGGTANYTVWDAVEIDGVILTDPVGENKVTYGPVTGTGIFQVADQLNNTMTIQNSNDRWIDNRNRLGLDFYVRDNITVLNADNPKHVAMQQAIADAFAAFPQKVNERRTAIASSFYRLMEGEALSAEEFGLLEETITGAVNASEPFALDGYYPLYYTSAKADAASSVGDHHVHNINGVNYYMPDGGTLYHGNYIAPETSTTDNNDSSY